jgi:hypothetical protein
MDTRLPRSAGRTEFRRLHASPSQLGAALPEHVGQSPEPDVGQTQATGEMDTSVETSVRPAAGAGASLDTAARSMSSSPFRSRAIWPVTFDGYDDPCQRLDGVHAPQHRAAQGPADPAIA